MVNLTTADISDSAGAQAILDAVRKRWPWVKHMFADAIYDRLKLIPRRSDRSDSAADCSLSERDFRWSTSATPPRADFLEP